MRQNSYKPQKKVENSIPKWGDAIVWSQHYLFLSA